MSAPSVGDYVRCHIPGHGTPPENAFILGWVLYDRLPHTGRIALIGGEEAFGMPVNCMHLTVLSSGHDVSKWRQRYLDRFPHVRLANDA